MQFFNDMDHRFAKISQREKTLVLLAGLFLLGMVGYLWFIEPQLKALSKEQQNLLTAQQQISQVRLQIQEADSALSVDPDVTLNKKWLALESLKHRLDLKYNQQTQDLIPASQMPKVLEKILTDSNVLKLVSMTSIAPTILIDGNADNNAGISIYQHGVNIVLEGKYFDIQQYLQQVQQLQWRFFWRQFNYQVVDFPLARVELSLYTLSSNQAFIGI
ncbi:type II secretion system protein GspM [Alteromonadaceae bacterium BrNp21-10]|nr:type II secretion system protein GspM [Alteromonadaceae bacterium BrNp21-10]